MTVFNDSPVDANELNPFSQIAVARVMESERPDPVTLDTNAIRTATSILDGYLAGEDGAVVAVLGDYGTGKSHLVMRLLRHVRATAPQDSVRYVYIEAPSSGFVEAYRRFIRELRLDEVRDRVKRFYAEVVAESLGDSSLTKRLADRLRTGDADPVTVVERFALMENTLMGGLYERLRVVTSDSAFAVVLMLLLRPGFEKSAWSWLQGEAPDEILTEYGVQTGIDSDTAALEAMGVVALLHRIGDRRFLLVIDELDKVLSAATNPDAAVLNAFRTLLQVFHQAGAMLVLVGVPDFLEVVPSDARQRIGTPIRMPLLDADQTREFIRLSMKQAFGRQTLLPFTEDGVAYLVRLARGVVRQIVRLCFNAYRLATEAGVLVATPVVEQVARDELYLYTTDHEVREAVVAVLKRNGWRYQVDHRLTDDPSSKVDYWIGTGGSERGYGVVVSGSVLNDEDVASLAAVASAIAAARGGEKGALLVVNGFLTPEVDTRLTDVFGTRPLMYGPPSFETALTDALTNASGFLTVPEGAGRVDPLRERIDQIQRQQASIHSFLEEVGVHLDRVGNRLERFAKVTDERFGALTDALTTPPAEESRRTAAELAMRPQELPEDVDRLFTGVLAMLGDLDRFDMLLHDVFDMEDVSRYRTLRGTIRSSLRADGTVGAAGVAVLLRKTIVAFRVGVVGWYRRHADVHAPLGQPERDQLDTLCSTYDSIAEYLPPFHVLKLGDLVSPTNEEHDPVGRTARREQQKLIRDLLDNLSMRVRQALLVSVGG
jgi:Cdc6-like AAA superfamily ATPase